MPALQEKTVLRLGIMCVVGALLLVMLVLAARLVPREILPTAQPASRESVLVQIDETKVDAWRVRIRGWAIQKGHPSQTFDTQVLLKAPNGTFYAMPTEMTVRPDVTAHFNDGNKYDASGFTVYGLSPAFFTKGPFSVYLLYSSNKVDILVDAGVGL